MSGPISECSGCGLVFNSPSSFDAHRIGSFEPDERRCLTMQEMLEKGFTKNDHDLWIKKPPTETEIIKLRGFAQKKKEKHHHHT